VDVSASFPPGNAVFLTPLMGNLREYLISESIPAILNPMYADGVFEPPERFILFLVTELQLGNVLAK
jgi:hypothetical protein